MDGCSVHRAVQHRFEGLPVRWSAERQPIGAAFPDGAGATAILVSHEIHRGEFDRRQVIRAVGTGKPIDVRLPPGRGHRYSKMIEGRAAADQRFSRGMVGLRYPTWIQEQPELITIEHPLPRLAVV